MSTVNGKLRVGFLTYGLNRPLSGVSRVVLELGRALHAQPECEVVYLTPYRRGPFRAEEGYASWQLPGCTRLPGLMVLGGPLIALTARLRGLDLVHDPVGISPFTLGRRVGPFRRVVTLHDAIAFRYPQGYPWLNNFLHRRYVPATLSQVDAVITVSRHSQQELALFLPLPAGGAHLVPNGVSGHFRPLPQDVARATAKSYGLSGPYILSVGAQQLRKNIDRLIASFAILREALPQYRLAVIGPKLWRYEGIGRTISELGLADAVEVLGYVPDAHLPALFGAADLFVFPSLYEGFGLPVLEAMACGCPVVCSDATSLPEVAGDAARLVDATNTVEMAEAMRQVLSDRELREVLIQRGLEHARRFSWQRAAAETVDVYRQVMANR